MVSNVGRDEINSVRRFSPPPSTRNKECGNFVSYALDRAGGAFQFTSLALLFYRLRRDRDNVLAITIYFATLIQPVASINPTPRIGTFVFYLFVLSFYRSSSMPPLFKPRYTVQPLSLLSHSRARARNLNISFRFLSKIT